jgi:hypothetical protein
MRRLTTYALLLLSASVLGLSSADRADGAAQCLVVNQVYADGGADPSTPNRSYVELLNRCSTSVALGGTYLHTLDSNNSSGSAVALGGSLASGRFFLAAFGTAGAGTALPTPDVSAPSVSLPSPGKVFLSTSSSVSASCPGGASLIDLVGYGTSSAPCVEGAAAPAPRPEAPVRRKSCADSDDNAADFTMDPFDPPLDPPAPRNSSLRSPLCGNVAPCLLISEVYGPGGGAGALYDRSYVELLNRCDDPISLDFVRAAVESGDNQDLTSVPLSGSLGSTQYFLVAFGNGAGGAALPTPDAMGLDFYWPGKAFAYTDPAFDIATQGPTCPSGPGLLDLVGYGVNSNPCTEGGSPAPLPSGSNSIARFRCDDSDRNWMDYTAGTPTPKNKAAGPLLGGCSGAATAVHQLSFAASRNHGAVTLRWQTGSQAGTLGFDVYRGSRSARVKVNRKLVIGSGSAAGRRYSFVDRGAPVAAATYWLRELRADGSRTWHGPVRAAKARAASS